MRRFLAFEDSFFFGEDFSTLTEDLPSSSSLSASGGFRFCAVGVVAVDGLAAKNERMSYMVCVYVDFD